MLLVFMCVGSPTSSAIAPRSLQAALRHARKTNTINSNSELWKTNTTTTKELSSSCTLHQPLGCGCACGECTFLHYIPIPKTGSEATKTWLSRIQGGLDSTYPPGASAPRLCANKSVCYLGPSTHEANKRLPQLPGSLGAPFSKPWWAQAHSPSCASLPGTRSSHHGNFVRVATIRNPYERFLSTFAVDHADAQKGGVLRRFFGVSRTTTAAQLLANHSSAMHALTSSSAVARGLHEHFAPAHEFVVTKAGHTRANVLLRFSHVQDDMTTVCSRRPPSCKPMCSV